MLEPRAALPDTHEHAHDPHASHRPASRVPACRARDLLHLTPCTPRAARTARIRLPDPGTRAPAKDLEPQHHQSILGLVPRTTIASQAAPSHEAGHATTRLTDATRAPTHGRQPRNHMTTIDITDATLEASTPLALKATAVGAIPIELDVKLDMPRHTSTCSTPRQPGLNARVAGTSGSATIRSRRCGRS